MLKKLCVVLLGLGFCLGTIGCSKSEEGLPKEKVPPPAAKPTSGTQALEVD